MPNTIPGVTDCCSVCDDVTTSQVPGPAGADGANGTNGADGINAFTTTTAQFVQPAINSNVTVATVDSLWCVVGQKIFISVGGYYDVVSVAGTGLSVTVKNLGYTGNAAPTTVIATSQGVSPGGIKGTDGAASSATLNDISPTTAKGDIIADNGAGAGSASDVKVAVGTDGKILVADSTQAAGLNYKQVVPNSATDNAIVRFDGASGTPVLTQTSKMIVTDNGALQSTPSGGNARGTDAVDLQVARSSAPQVASGTESTIGGGNGNKASGAESTVSGGATNSSTGDGSSIGGGTVNTASGEHSTVSGGGTNLASAILSSVGGGGSNIASSSNATVSGGDTNTASGSYSCVGGGSGNLASATYASVPSGFKAVANHYGQRSHASGAFATDGDAQTSDVIFRGVTTNNTPTEIFIDGNAVQLTIPSDTTWAFRMLIVARRADADDESAAYQLLGCIDRNSAANTTALVGTVGKTVIAEDVGGWDVDATADTTNGALVLTVTAENAKTVNWCCKCELVQLTA